MSSESLLKATISLASCLDRDLGGVLDGPLPGPGPGSGRPAADPVAEADRLRRELPGAGLAPARARWLDAQLVALRRTALRAAGAGTAAPGRFRRRRPAAPAGDRAAGDRITDDWTAEVRDHYGVDPRPGDPEVYRAAHHRLDLVLPGRGPLADRMRTYAAGEVVDPDRLGPAVEALSRELRRRTAEAVGLPRIAQADVELVTDRPWTALTRYRGGFRSTVRIDGDAGLRAGQLLPLLAHEIHPGHHVQACLADAASARYPEMALRLVHGPQATLAEGAAEAALLLVPGWGALAEEVLAGVGVRCDGELAEAVLEAQRPLTRVRLDAAVLRHVHGAGPDEVLAHLRRWLLVTDAHARRILGFLERPRWRGYPATYAEGEPLVRSWLQRHPDGPAAGLRALFDRPVLPADLAAPVTDGGDAARAAAF
ncbi:DUF885 domain-containing protein [Pseudonocardia phyllosphaerae]|uniref:DUF885 domain-containing protein n=1 Tax=Pseudonocardia phyllosphaerae TaxID=3390502 RepID=UPI0039780E1E